MIQREKRLIDVIMTSFTKDKSIFDMTQNAINSLLASEDSVQFNIYLIESNREIIGLFRKEKCSYRGCNIIMPPEEFNYNKFLNIGLSYCKSATVVICHNDVIFTKQWFSIISETMDKFNLESASPLCPVEYKYLNVNYKYEAYIGCGIGHHVLPHCVVLKREIVDKMGSFDEQFKFWRCLDDYSLTLEVNKIKHALVPYSIVNHLRKNNYLSDKKMQQDRLLEKTIFKQKWGGEIRRMPQQKSDSKKDIHLFFHICCINNYKGIVYELIDDIKKTGLYDKCVNVHYSLMGTPDDEFMRIINSLDKFKCVYVSDDIKEVEYPTLKYLQGFCKNKDAYVCYFHTKGVSTPDDEFRQLWRKRLAQKVLIEHEVCISFLNEGCYVSGCGWKERRDQDNKDTLISGPYAHFSGNFWWADSEYINKLPDIGKLKDEVTDVESEEYRLQCEFWLGMSTNIIVGVNGELNKEYSNTNYYQP